MNKKGLFDGWKWGKVSDIIDFNPKYTIKKGVKVKYIEMAAVPEHSREIEYFQSREFKSGSKFKNGETLFSRITPCLQNGKTSKVSKLKENEIANGSTEFIVLSPKDKRDEDFIYYLSLDNSFRKYAEKRMIGSTGRQRVSWQSLSEYKLLIPPLKNRIKIAEILSSLDDKIELNNQMNKNLENMAQTIFKQWFVDFEFPDENGKPYASNGGKFVDSEMGLIPEGWRVEILGDVIEISSGKRPKNKENKKSKNYNIPIAGASKIMGFTSKSLYNKKLLIIGRVGTHGIIQKFNGEVWPSDNTLVITSKFYEFVYQILQKINYKSLNIGSTQPLITQTSIKNIKIIYSNEKELLSFESLVKNINTKIIENKKENSNLIKTRDSLLPKLMSGEIRVGDMGE